MKLEIYSANKLRSLHAGIKRLAIFRQNNFGESFEIARVLRICSDKGIMRYLKGTRLDENFCIENVTFCKRKDALQFFREIEIVYLKTRKYALNIRIGCLVFEAKGYKNLWDEGFFDNIEQMSHLFILAQSEFRELHDMNTKQGLKIIYEQNHIARKMLIDLKLW